MKGYMGKILRVNLTAGSCLLEDTDEKIARQYLGGSGYASYIMYNEVPKGTDPLGPDNKIIFFSSPLSMNNVPGGGSFMIGFKSPATGGWGQARSGGEFGPCMRKSGLDGIIVEGRSEKPVYVEVCEEQIRLRDASHLADASVEERTRHMQDALPEDARNKSVVCCGPAGDKMVHIASVMCGDRAAGRGGGGAVMGSKNLVGIAVCGNKKPDFADRKAFIAAVKMAMNVVVKDNAETTQGFHCYGTTGDISVTGEGGDLPTGNWQSNSWEHGPALFDHFMKKNLVSSKGCYTGCPIGCTRVCKVEDGPYKTPVHAGGEYETVASFSAFQRSNDMDGAVHCGYLCNMLGLDTISAGSVIAFAMDCYEHGIITPEMTDGLEITWGNTEVMPKLLEYIAARKGIGDVLALGVKGAAAKLGNGAEAYAIHVKGLEGAAHDARSSKMLGLNYGTSTRGMCHIQPLDGVSYDKGKADFGLGKFGVPNPEDLDRYDEKGKGTACALLQRGHGLCDILSICKFMTYAGLTLEHLAAMMAAITGWDITDAELFEVGERVINLQKMFNVREGFGRKDDRLPRRVLSMPVDGPYAENKDCVFHDYESLLDEYYDANGWDHEGVPYESTLQRLDLLELINAGGGVPARG